MQYKLKMLQFILNAPSTFFSGQWAMPIHKLFIILSQFCSKTLFKRESVRIICWVPCCTHTSTHLKWFSTSHSELLHQERWRRGFGSTVSSKQICKLCKGYCLLAMNIYIRWTPRVLTMVPQVHSIAVYDTTLKLPVCCTCTLHIKYNI